jgi:hypothetical protein
VVQDVRVDVRDQVVHADQGAVERQRVGLRRRHPDQQGARQARADGDRERVHVLEPRPAQGEGLLDGGVEQVDVGAGGDLGDHAAVAGVQALLVGDDVGAHPAAVLDQRDGGLVAGGLDAQDQHGQVTSLGSGMRRASSARRAV